MWLFYFIVHSPMQFNCRENVLLCSAATHIGTVNKKHIHILVSENQCGNLSSAQFYVAPNVYEAKGINPEYMLSSISP